MPKVSLILQIHYPQFSAVILKTYHMSYLLLSSFAFRINFWRPQAAPDELLFKLSFMHLLLNYVLMVNLLILFLELLILSILLFLCFWDKGVLNQEKPPYKCENYLSCQKIQILGKKTLLQKRRLIDVQYGRNHLVNYRISGSNNTY